MVRQLTSIRTSPPMPRDPGAFTLAELMVSVGVILLLSAFSINLIKESSFLQDRRLRQAAVELQAHLLQARALAQKVNSSCQVKLTTSAPPTFGADSSFSPNACSSTNLTPLNLLTATNARGLAVVSGTTTTFTFTGIGTLAGSADAVTILSASNTDSQWCVKATAPTGLVLVGSRDSAADTCNYVKN